MFDRVLNAPLRIFSKLVNPFVPNAPFLYPLKTSENRKGVEKGCIGNKWVNVFRNVETFLEEFTPQFLPLNFYKYNPNQLKSSPHKHLVDERNKIKE